MDRYTTIKNRALNLLIAVFFVMPLIAGTSSIVAASNGDSGAVYTMTNSASGNAIQVFARATDGTLTQGDRFSTGGLGSGAGLGSQGAIVLSPNRHWLFAVNAGSNDVSVFGVQTGKLTLLDREPSGGTDPISLTFSDGLLYVLNAGNGGNIAGFRVAGNGHLSFLQGSVRPLSNNGSGNAPSPEEIGFTPDGSQLVVSEKGSNLIDTYIVDRGRAKGPFVNPSSGPAPYGFGFADHNTLVISEAANSAVSSYKVFGKELKGITRSLVDTQAAACWLVVTQDGKYAYAANAASGTLSGYQVSKKGNLTLLLPDGINGNTGSGSHPIDMAFGGNHPYLYVLASGNSTINIFRVNPDGSLTSMGSVSTPSSIASGLAAQ